MSVERVNKVKAYLRTQLTWVQNSLFEGELSDSRLMRVKKEISELINPEKDTITIYIFQNKNMFVREELGIRKGSPEELVI